VGIWYQGAPTGEFHQGLAHGSIIKEAQIRRTEALETVTKDNRIKGHERNSVIHANLLEAVIEVDHVLHL
jgi:ribosomal protein S19